MKGIKSASWFLGASCYWSYVLLIISAHLDEQNAGIPPYLSLVLLCANVAVTLAVMLLARYYSYLPTRRSLGIVFGIVCGIDFLSLFIFTAADEFGSSLLFLAVVLRGMRIALLMQFWGVRFAKTPLGAVSATVTFTAFLSLALFLIFFNTAHDLLNICGFTLSVISSICLLVVHEPKDTSSASPRNENALPETVSRKRLHFYLSRVLYGAGIGLVLGLTFSESNTVPSPSEHIGVNVFLGCAILLATLLWFFVVKKRELAVKDHWLITLPLIVSGLMIVAALNTGGVAYSRIATASAWLCWIILSSTQIPTLKKVLGMNEALLALVEKALVLLSWLIARLAVIAFAATLGADTLIEDREIANYLALFFSYSIVFAAVITLVRFSFASTRKNQEQARQGKTRDALMENCDNIAHRFRLTPREQEVLRLLATGRNRAYIQKYLFISEGTAKTHINHIHQKLGVSSQQELLNLVNMSFH